MALSAITRNNGGKRLKNVSCDEGSSTYSDYTSSDEEPSSRTSKRTKVRNVKSIRVLMKESNAYVKSDEHAYTQPTPHFGKRQFKDEVKEPSYSHRKVSKRTRCESKNAVNARLNREKKKAYIHSMEEELQKLRTENDRYFQQFSSQIKQIEKLQHDLSYARNLLANGEHLGLLVSKLSAVTGLSVTSSIIDVPKKEDTILEDHPRIRSVPIGANHPIARKDVNLGNGLMDDFDASNFFSDGNASLFPSLECNDEPNFNFTDFLPLDYPTDLENNVGFCVHINQQRLSVEFCSICNSKANAHIAIH